MSFAYWLRLPSPSLFQQQTALAAPLLAHKAIAASCGCDRMVAWRFQFESILTCRSRTSPKYLTWRICTFLAWHICSAVIACVQASGTFRMPKTEPQVRCPRNHKDHLWNHSSPTLADFMSHGTWDLSFWPAYGIRLDAWTGDSNGLKSWPGKVQPGLQVLVNKIQNMPTFVANTGKCQSITSCILLRHCHSSNLNDLHTRKWLWMNLNTKKCQTCQPSITTPGNSNQSPPATLPFYAILRILKDLRTKKWLWKIPNAKKCKSSIPATCSLAASPTSLQPRHIFWHCICCKSRCFTRLGLKREQLH